MAKCEVCGKGVQHGHNVSFSKRRTNRIWKANVRSATLTVDGESKRVKVCTQCLKTLSKTVKV
ncbi:MAG: 50S ribosomal protein L28 [Anaerolineae bacterium]